MSMLENVPSCIESGENFAYFCKFDRDTRTLGEERLFTGGEPFSAKKSIGRKINSVLNDAFRSDLEIPVIIPYDFITQVFPSSGIKRSEWPLITGFMPERIRKGTFRREVESSVARTGVDPDVEFSSNVALLRKRIISGEILQAVLSREFPLPHIDLEERLSTFLNSDHSLYVFLYRIGNFTVLGSSPENLITVSGKGAEIFPIAGTVPRGMTPEEDLHLGEMLLNSEKDKLEHRMLVDLARNDLGKISSDGSVRVTESMALKKYASVQHLVSHVESDISGDATPLEILKAVFPAGTVSGAPKKRAVEIIDSIETSPRGAYAGALGILGHDGMDLALLIRSIFCESGSCYTRAGAGIVKDSVPELESKEVMSKMLTVIGGLEDECVDY